MIKIVIESELSHMCTKHIFFFVYVSSTTRQSRIVTAFLVLKRSRSLKVICETDKFISLRPYIFTR